MISTNTTNLSVKPIVQWIVSQTRTARDWEFVFLSNKEKYLCQRISFKIVVNITLTPAGALLVLILL